MNILKHGICPQIQNQQSRDDDLSNANILLEVRDATQYYELDQCLTKSDN